MKVATLAEVLQRMPQNAQVYFLGPNQFAARVDGGGLGDHGVILFSAGEGINIETGERIMISMRDGPHPRRRDA